MTLIYCLLQGSQLNDYSKLNRAPRKTEPVLSDPGNNSAPPSGTVDTPSGYAKITSTDNYSEPDAKQTNNGNINKDYYYVLGEDDEYDYETPFFEPSNEERVLVSQIRNLKMQSIPTENLM